MFGSWKFRSIRNNCTIAQLREDDLLELYHSINSVCAQKVRIEHGLDSEFVADALAHHRKLLSWMADSLKSGPYLAGESFSNADCAVVPYILRLELLKLSGMWDRYPSVAEWWGRMRMRASVKAAIIDRMTEADTAPFKNFAPDPWPKVQELLKAA